LEYYTEPGAKLIQIIRKSLSNYFINSNSSLPTPIIIIDIGRKAALSNYYSTRLKSLIAPSVRISNTRY
jgi:hypothetical protein